MEFKLHLCLLCFSPKALNGLSEKSFQYIFQYKDQALVYTRLLQVVGWTNEKLLKFKWILKQSHVCLFTKVYELPFGLSCTVHIIRFCLVGFVFVKHVFSS